MSELVYAWLAVILGIAGLVWSADRFVAGSAAIASNFGISKLVIGLTIVSLGTSAPEILVSVNASLDGEGALAVGNALGSNIANIGLVLSITALIAAIPIQKHILTQEFPALLLVTVLAGVFLYDRQLVLWEGAVLIALIIPIIYAMIRYKKSHPEDAEDEDIPNMNNAAAAIWFVIGLVLLIASSDALVYGATRIATHFGVSSLVIGLTVVAVGTSLPELAASVVSAIKGHHDIALGNIVGSNLFNILTVMSIPGIVGLEAMEASVFTRDYLMMLGLTLFLFVAVVIDFKLKGKREHGHLGKLIGSLLLLSYIGYYVLLFNS
ncbi:calcium/sodium antiporter [Aurantivibrio plasticivorans]